MSAYDDYVRLEKIEIPKLEAEMTSAASKLADANRGIDQVFNLCTWLIVAHRNCQ